MRTDNITISSISPYQSNDLGFVTFLRLRGVYHCDMNNNGNEVSFRYDRDLSEYLHEYWNDLEKVAARKFKMEFDSVKRLTFSYLKNRGIDR